jgi:spore germination cell wall hydrolase CwlJ-like protein
MFENIIPIMETISLALTVYLEAECQPLNGKQAIANVIYNRSYNLNKSITEVIFQPKQFSCWDSKGYVLKRLSKVNTKKLYECFEIVKNKSNEDITNGATHYVKKGIKKVWMKKMKKTIVIGDHKFMKQKGK